MSSYDDPRWYEQPEYTKNDHKPSANDFRSPEHNVLPESRRSRYFPEPNGGWRRTFGQFVVIAVLMVIAFLGGWYSHQVSTTSFDPSNQSQSYENLFQQAWNDVDQYYVDRKAVNYKEMSYAAIRAMLAVLHDTGHTYFLTPEELQAENQQLSGTFVGVGLEIVQDQKTKQFVITSVLPGSPAEKAGFKPGDIVLAVNGTSTAGKSNDTVHSEIHDGKAGSSVTLTVQRPSTKQTLTIKVTRAAFKVQNVLMHYIAEDHIAHIQIVQFADGVSDQLQNDLVQAKKMGATRIILDLRDNPGGYLDQAIRTVSEFVAKGNVLLEQDSSGQRKADPVTGSPLNTTSPMVVLVNSNSASAAEIVSGALQDDNRAVIIGTKTLGTGTVLTQYPLSDGSAIFLGTSEWLTPKGHFIRGQGITPNISVVLKSGVNPLTPSAENQGNLTEQQILNSGDTQVDAAIHYLDTKKGVAYSSGADTNVATGPTQSNVGIRLIAPPSIELAVAGIDAVERDERD